METEQKPSVEELKVEPQTEDKTPEKSQVKIENGVEVKKEISTEKTSDSVQETTEEPSELDLKIIRQVEYYFGDSNLSRDRFLQEQIQLDDGWVPMETMLKFKRLSQLSEDSNIITDALKKSKTKLMEVSDDKTKIRRSPDQPLPENTKERRDEIMERSIYAKGFPLDVTLDQLLEYFGTFAKIDNLFMKKHLDRSFKGSVYVTFADKAAAVKFVKEDQKYGESEIQKSSKKDYHDRKAKEVQELKEEKKKKRIEEEQKKLEEEEEKMKAQITYGAVVELTGIKADTKMEDIKNYFADFGNVAWVDLEDGETKAKVRFSGDDLAEAVLKKVKEANDGKIIINTAELEARLLEGEEELEHWQEILKIRAGSRDRPRHNKNKFRGRSGGKYQGKRYRNDERRSNNQRSDEPSEKKAKVD